MKVDVLGAKCLPSAGPTDQTVVPRVGLPAESVQVKAVPPQGWTSIPRCFLYQSHSVFGSLALMKMPPMPVTLRIRTSDVDRDTRPVRCNGWSYGMCTGRLVARDRQVGEDTASEHDPVAQQ